MQDLLIQKLFLFVFLFGILHFGVLFAVRLLAVAIALVLLLVSRITLKVVEVLKGRHDELFKKKKNGQMRRDRT